MVALKCSAVAVTAAIILTLVISGVLADNVYLYRLKKLRNTFHAQIEDQVTSNDDAMVKSYGDTVLDMVQKLSDSQRSTREEIAELVQELHAFSQECLDPIQAESLFTRADQYMQLCIADTESGAENLSAYVIQDADQYQSRSNEFSLWFMSAYLSDWEVIFGEKHYDDVYNELDAQVVQWDNVGSIGLYTFRQDVIKRLSNLSTTLQQCTATVRDYITSEYEELYAAAVACR